MSNGERKPAAAESVTTFERAYRISSPSGRAVVRSSAPRSCVPSASAEDAVGRAGLVRDAQPLRRLDDREHRRPCRAQRRDRLWRRLRQHQEVDRQPVNELDVARKPLGVRGVQPHDPCTAVPRPPRRPPRRSRGRLPSRRAPCRPRGRRSPRPRRPRAPSGACAPPRQARRAATSAAETSTGDELTAVGSGVERLQVALVRQLPALRRGDLGLEPCDLLLRLVCSSASGSQ